MTITRQQWKAVILQATALEQRLAEIESPDPEALEKIAPYVGFGRFLLPDSFLDDENGYAFMDLNWHALEVCNINDFYEKTHIRDVAVICDGIISDAKIALTGKIKITDELDFDAEVTPWEAAQNLVRFDVLELIARNYSLDGADRIIKGIDAARKPFRDATDPHKTSTEISEVFGHFYVHDPWSLYDDRGFTKEWAERIYKNAQKVGAKFDKHDDTGKLLLAAFAAEYFVELSLKREAYGDDEYSLKWHVREQMEVLNRHVWEELTDEGRNIDAGQTHMHYVNVGLQRADPKLAEWYRKKVLTPYDARIKEKYRWGMMDQRRIIESTDAK